MKLIIALGLMAVLGCLASALYFMLGKREDETAAPARRSRRMARALAWRIGLSIALFAAILMAYALGWLTPSGLPAPR